MKKILKTFLKINDTGSKLYEGVEELIDDENGTITNAKTETLATCRSCGRTIEQNQARSNCPVCKGRCCDFCHEERLKLEKSTFERQIVLEREQLRWLESRIFDNLPAIGIIRQIRGIKSIKRLERLHRRLPGGRKEDG